MIGNVLALDLATKTGWCVLDDGGQIRSGAHDFGKRLPGHDVERRHAAIFSRAASTIADLLHEWRPSVVVYEVTGSHTMRGQAAPLLLGLRAMAVVAAYRHEALIDPVARISWQSWAKRQGWTPADKSDQADAEWIGRFWFANRAGLVVREAA
jgi:hypothetical protein